MAAQTETTTAATSPIGLRSLLVLAFRLGLLGFGGGYAVLAQLRTAVVDRRRWLSDEEYLDAVAVAQSLPGASGANFFTLIGMRSAGFIGAALSTTLFLLPSAALMALFGAYYDKLRSIGRVEAIFTGMNPAVVAIVAAVTFTLGKPMRQRRQILIAAASLVAVEAGFGVLEVVLAAISIGLFPHARRILSAVPRSPPALAVSPLLLALAKLSVVFLRIGAATFGGGLAMIPALDHQIVDTLHWLTPREFSDGVTLGQITPGPVAITATFVGYRVAGLGGAAIATLATFLPAFIATFIAGRSVQRFRQSAAMQSLFEALAPAIVGIVGAAAISLARTSIHGWADGAIAFGSLALLIGLRAPPLLVLALAAGIRAVAPLLAH